MNVNKLMFTSGVISVCGLRAAVLRVCVCVCYELFKFFRTQLHSPSTTDLSVMYDVRRWLKRERHYSKFFSWNISYRIFPRVLRIRNGALILVSKVSDMVDAHHSEKSMIDKTQHSIISFNAECIHCICALAMWENWLPTIPKFDKL